MQRNNNSQQRFAQPFPASQKYVIFVNNGKWNPIGGGHVVKWAKKKKRKKGMWTYYTQENGVRLSFTYYYDFLWGKISRWVMFWNLILLKALYLLRLFATWEEVEVVEAKFPLPWLNIVKCKKSEKYRSLLLLLVRVYFTFEHAQSFKPSKKYITVVTLWCSGYCILSLHTTSCKQYEKRKNQKAVNLLWTQKFSSIKEEEHHR